MFIDTIKENWKFQNKDDQAAVKLWDQKADHFGKYDLEEVQNERFVQIIRDNNLIDEDSLILDVGCGAGRYCTALADDCFKAVGTDLSPKMIEYAQKRAEEYGKQNVEFRCDDWSKIDIKKEGLYQKFDLIMACMTPAICDYNTFMKFFNCGKNAGIYCGGTQRKDTVADEIEKILGIKKYVKESEQCFLYIFNILWENGYYPTIEYVEQGWDSEMELDKALNVYLNKSKAKYNVNQEQEEKIVKYLNDISQNGVIYERIDTVKAIMYWKK